MNITLSESDRKKIIHLRELLKKNAPMVYDYYRSYKLRKSHERIEVREQTDIK